MPDNYTNVYTSPLNKNTIYFYYKGNHLILHRTDGPARENGDGSIKYYLHNELFSEEEYYKRLKLKAFW